METYDIVIIGGGAAGIAAAIEAKRTDNSLHVLILEKLDRIGKKILITGNGRCNLGNSTGYEGHYNSSEIIPILDKYGDTEAFFGSMGLLTRTDEEGRMYPASNSATSVTDALRFEAERLKTEILTSAAAVSITPGTKCLTIKTSTGPFRGKRCIIATGGKAAPKYGTEGDGCKIAKSFGLAVNEESPALVAVRTDDDFVRALKGQRSTALAKGVYEDGKEKSRFGEVQFGDGVLSGICIFDLAQPGLREVHLDFLPHMKPEDVRAYLFEVRKLRGEQMVENFLTGAIPKRVGMQLIKKKLKIPMNTLVRELNNRQITEIAEELKDRVVTVTETRGWDSAQVTAGGVSLGELTGNLESRKVKGLFFVGETVDVNGDCGGYNLAWAWASGRCAGRAAARSLEV